MNISRIDLKLRQGPFATAKESGPSAPTARRASLSHSVGQIFACVVGQIRSIFLAVSCSLKGRFAIVTDR
ncbi:hypothetical protein, partial [Bradyrhizobium sp. HKCCYLS20291]|uniref:hypothetical protein n=1 Tax=Bradyrhizobium sp. HKCCYLS20291 TaxID=3420766 RepID=UPI003EB746D6